MASLKELFLSVRNRCSHSSGAFLLCVLCTLAGYGTDVSGYGADVWGAMSEEEWAAIPGYDKPYYCRPSFAVFLPVFSADALSSGKPQMGYTVIPLQKSYIDSSSGPEPLTIEQTLTLDEITYPVFPSPQEVKSGLLQIVEAHGTKARVRISKPDTDYLVEYFFEYDRCWRLHRIEDRSQAPRADVSNEERYCARDNFQAFLDVFSGSVEVQKKYTVIPLQKSYYTARSFSDHGSPFLRVEEMLALDELHYPLSLSYRQVVSEGATLELEVSGTQAIVAKNWYTRDVVFYYFEHDRCWRLSRIEDWSE